MYVSVKVYQDSRSCSDYQLLFLRMKSKVVDTVIAR